MAGKVKINGGWWIKTMALVLLLFTALPLIAEEKPAGDASAFKQLTKEQRTHASMYLVRLLEESVPRAQEKIRQNGSFVPFAYAGNHTGRGQFIRLPEDDLVKADVAAHVLQQAIVTSALKGELVASALYLTVAAPEQLGQLRQGVEDALESGQSMTDMRFLLVELQHVAGLSLVHVVPYWQTADGSWAFASPVQIQVEPRLHQRVHPSG